MRALTTMTATLLPMVFLLGACSAEHKVSVPAPVRGVWGADCASPVVAFTETAIRLYAENATYALESVTFDGNDLNVKYTSARGPVAETYMKSGETLRLDHATYGGVAAPGSDHAMNRCP